MIYQKSECSDHPYFFSDCPHCEELIIAATEIVQMLHGKGITLREAMVATNMAMLMLVDSAFSDTVTSSDKKPRASGGNA